MVSCEYTTTSLLSKQMAEPTATESAQPGPWAGRGGCIGPRMVQEVGLALDLAESLWWVAVSIGRQNFGIDLASSPRQATTYIIVAHVDVHMLGGT